LEHSDSHHQSFDGCIKACAQLGYLWMDKKKIFAILALLEPECAITADAIGFIDTYQKR